MADKKRLLKSNPSGFQSAASQVRFVDEMILNANNGEPMNRDGLYRLGVIPKQPREIILRLIDCLKEI